MLMGGWKYIDLPRAECYDVRTDPGEKDDVISSETARVDRMRYRLEEWMTQSRQRNVDAVRAISPEERRRLESLGYISPGAARAEGKALPDPKDLIAGWTENVTGKTLLDSGDAAGAEAHLLKAIELNPVFFNPYIDVARLRIGRGDIEGGLSILKRGADNNPEDAAIKIEYARALGDADRLDEALAVLREAEKRMVYGQHETVEFMIGVTLSRMDRFAEAAGRFRRALEIEPDNPVTARELGYCLYQSGNHSEAVSFYKQAETGMPDDPVIAAELALCQAALKDYAAASASFEKAVRLGPSQQVYFNYALMTAEAGDLRKAADLMAASLRQAPQDPRMAAKASSLLEEWKNRLSR
jgi:Flp pilus assembly protein TadD